MRLEHLLMIVDWMDLPLVTTFETPVEDNGELPERLENLYRAGRPRHVKDYFGCMTETAILANVAAMGVRQIAVAGAETDATTESSPGPVACVADTPAFVVLRTRYYSGLSTTNASGTHRRGRSVGPDPA